jgi:hypothetical protein
MQAFKTLATSQQLKGKIFWQQEDSTKMNTLLSKNNTPSLTSARLDNVVITEHMIRFSVQPYEMSEETWSYTVYLSDIDHNGTKYSGYLRKGNDLNHCGEITCELFNNSSRYMLYGKWSENNVQYTWWSIVERNSSFLVPIRSTEN